jgi:hypothetical protein
MATTVLYFFASLAFIILVGLVVMMFVGAVVAFAVDLIKCLAGRNKY